MREKAVILRKRVALLVPPTRLRVRWRRRPLVKLVHSYLDGMSGLEIGGAAQNDFGLDALNVDRYASMETVYKRAEKNTGATPSRWTSLRRGTSCPCRQERRLRLRLTGARAHRRAARVGTRLAEVPRSRGASLQSHLRPAAGR